MSTDLWLLAGVSLAGGIGALVRFVLLEVRAQHAERSARDRVTSLPWALLVINVSGSALAGGGVCWALLQPESRLAVVVIVAGFCGGFTTLSTLSQELFRLARHRRWGALWVFGPGQMVLGAVSAAAGAALVQMLLG